MVGADERRDLPAAWQARRLGGRRSPGLDQAQPCEDHRLVERLTGIDYGHLGGVRVPSYAVRLADGDGGDGEVPLEGAEWAD
jgi:hypothetical protein